MLHGRVTEVCLVKVEQCLERSHSDGATFPKAMQQTHQHQRVKDKSEKPSQVSMVNLSVVHRSPI